MAETPCPSSGVPSRLDTGSPGGKGRASARGSLWLAGQLLWWEKVFPALFLPGDQRHCWKISATGNETGQMAGSRQGGYAHNLPVTQGGYARTRRPSIARADPGASPQGLPSREPG